MNNKNENFWADFNETLKEWPNKRTTNDIDFIKADEYSSRSPSAQQSQQKHSDKRVVSSRAAFTAAHSPTNTAAKPQPKPLLAPKPKMTALKPAAQLKPKI